MEVSLDTEMSESNILNLDFLLLLPLYLAQPVSDIYPTLSSSVGTGYSETPWYRASVNIILFLNLLSGKWVFMFIPPPDLHV